MRHLSKHILALTILLLPVFQAGGSDSLQVRRLYHDLTIAASAGYNLPSHGYYNGYNSLERPIPANSSLHLEYALGFTGATHLGRLYPGVTQGIGLAACTFFEYELMGTPVFAYVFQNARIHEFKPGVALNYSWNLGASYGWRTNEMIASPWNVYVNVGLNLSWDISKRWTLGMGPEFSHCSNGDTAYPNGGANLIDFRISLTGHIEEDNFAKDRSEIIGYESQLRNKSFKERMTYDLILGGGVRAGKVTGKEYALINEAFPFFSLYFMPMYRLNRYFSAGASLDLLADRSANLYDVYCDKETREVILYTQPPIYRQMAAGLSVHGDITMPVFTIGAGIGGFVLGSGQTLRGLYTTFSLKAFMTERLFLNVTYRLSARNYTHNLMYGLGWRFN